MQQLEVFSGDGIFVALTQKAHLIGVFQVFEPGGITSEFLNVVLHRPRILHAAVNQLLFTVPLYLEGDNRQHHHSSDGNEGNEQDERDENVSALGASMANEFW